MSKNAESLSRRSFIAAAGVTAAAAAAAPTLASVALADEPAQEEVGSLAAYEPAEVLEADVVVVGGGASGIGALLEAYDLGAKVIVIEKGPGLGGMSLGTEGVFGWGSKMQLDEGVEIPSVLDIIGEELVYSNFRIDTILWRQFIEQAGETIDWLMDHGVEFDRVDTYNGASFFKSFHWWPGGNGAQFGSIIQNWLEGKEGFELLFNTRAVDLVIEDGAVKGVYAKREDGSIVQVNGKGVIIATGGFSADQALLTQLTPDDWSRAAAFPGGNVGDGYRLMKSAGGVDGVVSTIQVLCVHTPDTQDLEPINVAASYESLPRVNELGLRYMAEDAYAKYMSILAVNAVMSQPANWALFSQETIDRLENEGCQTGFVIFKPGTPLTGLRDQLEQYAGCDNVKKADTLEELAEQIGCDPETLVATVERWNGFCETGVDEDYGIAPNFLIPIGTGPYFAVQSDRLCSASIGGIKIDRQQRVFDENRVPIPGLYSAGVDSCCLYKETYNIQISGGMMAYNVYSGRNAVRQIVGE